ncbi:uncharacterized protein LOC128127437 [Lactuca sativa]|uniref:uncharacterized protein LOC128127437 n=1 Tax=Lactuca sativa TaxID=4236 RepID=UPI0022AEA3CF|nr:uncharacterized protein LOC128127437 [Lactuca sativa]
MDFSFLLIYFLEGGGAKKGILGRVVGKLGMVGIEGNGGKETLGMFGMLGICGSGNVGMVGICGCGIVGIVGICGCGIVGIVGICGCGSVGNVVACSKLREAKHISFVVIENSAIAKM